MTLKSLHPLRYIEDAEDGDIPFVATPSAESTMAEIEECMISSYLHAIDRIQHRS